VHPVVCIESSFFSLEIYLFCPQSVLSSVVMVYGCQNSIPLALGSVSSYSVLLSADVRAGHLPPLVRVIVERLLCTHNAADNV
jgi:hypothetical protein